MDKFFHRFSELFAQLGLPFDSAGVRQFIDDHLPLDPAIRLEDAPFWTTAQATLLREKILDDADWSEVVDQLNTTLRSGSSGKS